jgi:hypothetical protein
MVCKTMSEVSGKTLSIGEFFCQPSLLFFQFSYDEFHQFRTTNGPENSRQKTAGMMELNGSFIPVVVVDSALLKRIHNLVSGNKTLDTAGKFTFYYLALAAT